MRISITFAVFMSLFLSLGNASARDSTLHISISEARSTQKFIDALDQDVKFYFGDQKYPTPKSRKGEFITNKKTNAFNKSDQAACEWVFLSALLALRDRALAEGGNAVVDIVSYYKKREYRSNTEIECHAGNIIAGIALKGRVVTLP